MKRYARMGGLICTLCLILAVLPPAFADAPSVGLTILFTHDTHDHFLPDAADMGGYTRLTALLKEQREAPTPSGFTYPTITLDAGDFSMGSLFQTIYTTDAPELRALGAMGYDVTTLGNHEFDYRQQGLAARKAYKQGVNSPAERVRWLNRCSRIVIDPETCPLAAEQFPALEYVITPSGDITETLPKVNDDAIDAVGYAASIWIRQGL